MLVITTGLVLPFSEKKKWINELINEYVILNTIYFVMCFSPFVSSLYAQNILGYAFCAMMGLHTLANIGNIVIS